MAQTLQTWINFNFLEISVILSEINLISSEINLISSEINMISSEINLTSSLEQRARAIRRLGAGFARIREHGARSLVT